MLKRLFWFAIGFAACYWMHHPQEVKYYYTKFDQVVSRIIDNLVRDKHNLQQPAVSHSVVGEDYAGT